MGDNFDTSNFSPCWWPASRRRLASSSVWPMSPGFRVVRQDDGAYFCRIGCAMPGGLRAPSSKRNWKLVWENNRECYHCADSRIVQDLSGSTVRHRRH
jgi:hypothetical protein